MILVLQSLSKGQTDQVKLGCHDLFDDDIQQICRIENIPHHKIRKLDLYVNKITKQGIGHLSKMNWNNLTQISLHSNRINAKGCQLLTRASMKSLKSLNISNNQLGSEGVLHISKGEWKLLTDLQIRRVKKGPVGVFYLFHGNWPKVAQLDIGQSLCNVNEAKQLQDDQMIDLVLAEFQSAKNIYINRFPCLNTIPRINHGPKVYQRLNQKFDDAKIHM